MACLTQTTTGGCHPLSPTSVVSMKVREIPSSLRSVNSSVPSRIEASRKSVLKFASPLASTPPLYSKSQTFTSSWLSTMMNLLSRSIMLSRLFSGKPCTTMLTGLSPFFCWFVERLLIKLSQTLFGAACARNTSASRRSVLSCVTRSAPSSYTAHIPRTTGCIASFSARGDPTMKHTYDKVTPSCPSIAMMIRLK